MGDTTAAQELARLTGLQDSVRAEIARLAALLVQESGRTEPAGAPADGGENR